MWPPSERSIRSIRKCLLSRLGEAAFAQIATPNARTGRGFGTVLAQPGREGFELFPPIHSPRWMIADVLDGLTPPTTQRFAISPRWMIADVLDGLTPPTTQRFAMRSSPTRAATDGGACGLCGRDLARHRPKLISVASRQIPRFRGWRLVSDTKLVSHRGETWIGRP